MSTFKMIDSFAEMFERDFVQVCEGNAFRAPATWPLARRVAGCCACTRTDVISPNSRHFAG
eukprot:858364-Prymnesium_polylepis.2